MKSKTKKNATSIVPHSSTEVAKLRGDCRCPETVSHFLNNLPKLSQAEQRTYLLKLYGKELTKILNAIGKPGLNGKRKDHQITSLLDAMKN